MHPLFAHAESAKRLKYTIQHCWRTTDIERFILKVAVTKSTIRALHGGSVPWLCLANCRCKITGLFNGRTDETLLSRRRRNGERMFFNRQAAFSVQLDEMELSGEEGQI